MDIFVLVKQTYDTEEKIVLRDGALDESGVKFIINPYDEYAVEEAIRIRDQFGGVVYVVSVGPERVGEALRTALAMGADEAVWIDLEGEIDETGLAKCLAAYLEKQHVDLVLGGYFSVDNGAGQVAVRTAELLRLPHVTSVTKLVIDDGKATCERDAEGDVEHIEVTLPAVITAQQGLNEPRYPSLPGIMKAKRKPFQRITPTELGLSEEDLRPIVQRTMITLPAKRKAGILLQGEISEQVKALVQHLQQDDKVI